MTDEELTALILSHTKPQPEGMLRIRDCLLTMGGDEAAWIHHTLVELGIAAMCPGWKPGVLAAVNELQERFRELDVELKGRVRKVVGRTGQLRDKIQSARRWLLWLYATDAKAR